eukprot:TRINITY_DN23556_c0_g1_i1.p1 TRINITY_DN23556_c0_g1~~TRINITY_DN23556_c0_g1_i1.p1  ORF type:complete len:815 (+),score=113.05 TRINITY_DN23556_c0_g1_i1:55-2499(+)
MVSWMLAGAGFAGVYSWASGVYSYNREAWMNDIQVEQAHAYQEDNLRISMHSMHREEIRDLVDSDINKINNSILVATLILSLAGEMLVEGQIPKDCPAFVLNAYMLCLGSAIFHLSMSILFGICSSSEAYKSAARLLTKTIRPDWDKIFKRLKRREATETTATFENMPLSAMMMPPLASRLRKTVRSQMHGDAAVQPATAAGDTDASHDDAGSSQQAASERRHTRPPTTRKRPSVATAPCAFAVNSEWLEDGEARDMQQAEAEEQSDSDEEFPADLDNDVITPEHIGNVVWRRKWTDYSQDWTQYSSCMFKCVAFGVTHLLEACGYLAVGTLYSGYADAWAFWAVQILFSVINVLVVNFFLARFKAKKVRNKVLRWVITLDPRCVACIVASGPFFCVIAAATSIESWDRVLVPMCYGAHTLVECFFIDSFVDDDLGDEQQEEKPAADGDNSRSGNDTFRSMVSLAGDKETDTALLHGCPDPEDPDRVEMTAATCKTPRMPSLDFAGTRDADLRRSMPKIMLHKGLIVIKLLWISAFVWALWGAAFGMDFQNEQAVMPMMNYGPRVLKTESIHFDTPSPYFRPHALVCPKGKIFVADKYRVFELVGKNMEVRTFKCNVTGTIADIGATCTGNICSPVVLLNGNPPHVLDCKTGEQLPLLQTSMPATKLAVYSSEPLGPGHTIFASVDNIVTAYGWSLEHRGWAPWWDVTSRQNEILSIDIMNGQLIMFREKGLVEVQDLKSGQQCGLWTLPQSTTVIGGGCAEPISSSVLVLAANGHGTKLLKAYMPIFEVCPKDTARPRPESAAVLSGRGAVYP